MMEAQVLCSSVLVAQSCPTLCDPMDCGLPGSSVHRILQARHNKNCYKINAFSKSPNMHLQVANFQRCEPAFHQCQV